jgi:hypothetical protein
MAIKRFNWDLWDTTTPDGEGDVYRTDNLYECASLIPGISSSTSSSPVPIPGISGCQLYMPPRIESFNIIPSSLLEFRIYGSGIQ